MVISLYFIPGPTGAIRGFLSEFCKKPGIFRLQSLSLGYKSEMESKQEGPFEISCILWVIGLTGLRAFRVCRKLKGNGMNFLGGMFCISVFEV